MAGAGSDVITQQEQGKRAEHGKQEKGKASKRTNTKAGTELGRRSTTMDYGIHGGAVSRDTRLWSAGPKPVAASSNSRTRSCAAGPRSTHKNCSARAAASSSKCVMSGVHWVAVAGRAGEIHENFGGVIRGPSSSRTRRRGEEDREVGDPVQGRQTQT